jgi:NAD(P)-dependent dehydrogenase (short-subunit alcohol dehydrogenase family)
VDRRTVLVTGASFGIGEATARRFARAGAEVVLVARTAEKLEQLVEEITAAGGRAVAYPADLRRVEEIPGLMARIEAAHPRLDVIVLNAGTSIRRRITESSGTRDLDRSIALNFTGPAAIVTALLPRLLDQGGAHVVSVSTVAALQPGAPRWGTYQGSKSGFDVWLRSVATELRPRGITASSVYLPLVRTRMITPIRFYAKVPALTPDEAAQVLAHAVVSRRDRVAPWWLWWCQLGTLLLRTPVDRALTALDRRTP